MSLRCRAHRLVPRAAVERFQEWIYHTDIHPIEAVISENYFLSAYARLNKGDLIVAYSVGNRRVQRIEAVVSRSDREAVIIAPFAASHWVDAIQVFEAGLLNDRPAPADFSASCDQDASSKLQLEIVGDGVFQITTGGGSVVVGDINGHECGVDLFRQIVTGKLSVSDAQRAGERPNTVLRFNQSNENSR